MLIAMRGRLNGRKQINHIFLEDMIDTLAEAGLRSKFCIIQKAVFHTLQTAASIENIADNTF